MHKLKQGFIELYGFRVWGLGCGTKVWGVKVSCLESQDYGIKLCVSEVHCTYDPCISRDVEWEVGWR